MKLENTLFMLEVYDDGGGFAWRTNRAQEFVHKINKRKINVRVYYLNALNCYVVLETGEDYRRFTGFETLKEAMDYASSKEQIKKLNREIHMAKTGRKL